MSVQAIIVAAGQGARFGASQNKALLPLMGRPLFVYALCALMKQTDHVCLVIREDELKAFEDILKAEKIAGVSLVYGGKERRHSVENALKALPQKDGIVLVHDAARPFPSQRLIKEVIEAAKEHGAAVPALPVRDTLRKLENERTDTVPREGLYQVQTPQGFDYELIVKAYQQNPDALSDDAGLVELLGHSVKLTQGEAKNFKITYQEDWDMAHQLLQTQIRVGTGFDTHKLVNGRKLVLCGVNIPHELGLLGHSDADVALHALMDAMLGACALGDIGRHFPDTDMRYKGADSLKLLEETVHILSANGFACQQADITILAQKPKLAPYIEQMRSTTAQALGLPMDRVSVKATTNEGIGYVGREEGISAQAVVTVAGLGEGF